MLGKLVIPDFLKIWALLRKLETDLYDAAIPLLGIYPKDPKTQWIGIPMFIAILFHNNQNLEATQVTQE